MLLLLTAASGFAGLGYQIVWTQQLGLLLGHEAAAVLAVVAAFFGGLSLGALSLGQRIDRSARPERWVAACELVIAAWGLALAVLIKPAGALALALTGAEAGAAWQWAVAFGGSFLLLLPATAAMGATLPAMERVTARWRSRQPVMGAIYAANTLGAVAGVLAAAFWLVPELGLMRTAGVCALLNLSCAAAVLALAMAPAKAPYGRHGEASAAAVELPSVASSGVPLSAQRSPARVSWLLGATGLLGIGYEVLVVRVLSQVTENTVYTFAILLAVYLVGTALGAAAYQRWLSHRAGSDGPRNAPRDELLDRLLVALALACLIGCLGLWSAESLRDFASSALGGGMIGALTAEAIVSLAAFGLPTCVMGALFTHLGTQARDGGIAWGRALGINTLGAAAAPLLFGVVLVPAIGAKFTLLCVAAGYLALSSRRAWRRPGTCAAAGGLIVLGVWAPALVFIDLPQGSRLVSYSEGAMAAVSVVEDARGVARLRIDNRQQEGSSASGLADGRQALLPLLLHAAPHRALFLGLGTGVTASTAAADPTLQVDAVELLPEVIEASAHFVVAPESSASAPRLRSIAADARRYVRTAASQYDVIVSDNFHPARSGSAALYTVEHFEAVRARLAPGGLFCQWLPLHQLDLDTLRSIVRAFMSAYPEGMALLATNSLETPVLGLVARQEAQPLSLRGVHVRLAHSTASLALPDYGIADEWSLLGSFVAGPRALLRFAGDAPLNTDDHPIVAYRAPRITYAPDSLPRERLMGLLAQLNVEPSDVIDATSDAAGARRLAAYWSARDRFIAAGRAVEPSSDVRQMLAQVREPLLDVLRTSPDFRPAYDPLVRMAAAWARTDVAGARELLMALQRAQPARPEAGQALLQLAPAAP